MRLVNIPLFVLTISIAFGVLCSYSSPISLTSSLILFGLSLVVTCIFFIYLHKQKSKSILFNFVTIFTFFTFGNLVFQLHQPKNYKAHYTNILERSQYTSKKHEIFFILEDQRTPSKHYYNYVVDLISINSHRVQGKVLLRIPKASYTIKLIPRTILSTYAYLEELPKALNPNQFDYSKYLNSKFIYHQLTLQGDKMIAHTNESFSLKEITFKIRSSLLSSFKKNKFKDQHIAFMSSLILGQRQELDADISNAFRNAGVIHVLAVSGLHIGIMLLFLNFVLKPLERVSNYGRLIKTTIIILILWSYAVVSGLSPSVLRAVTMFTFIAIAIQGQKRTATFNALTASFLLLICYRPTYLFEVGFQLSYIAVLSILALQPKINTLIKVKNIILKKIWELCSVTLAAQIGLFPLLLYYFHQFPLLFLISNLLVIPMITILLFGGVGISILSISNNLPTIIREIYTYLLDLNFKVVKTIASYNSFNIQNIHFSLSMVLTSYTALLLILVSLKLNSKRRVQILTVVLLLMSSSLLFEKRKLVTKKELVIFNKYKNTLVGVLNQHNFSLYTSKTRETKDFANVLNPYLTANKASLDTVIKLENVYDYNGLNLLRINTEVTFDNITYSPDILLLTDSPKIHLTKVIRALKPKLIIADGSNYKTDINRWQETCIQLNIPFHRTDHDGAFITTVHP
ncbi:ComEC/Rec2 family competence protein [Aquimarina sp. W85]|uniref:ComEC/Rec2 family competence protein n=1 Tax=Aquimarina rhodophyticola TaxID=3342246 RepID=UPI003672CC75